MTNSDRAILVPGEPRRGATLQKVFEWYLADLGYGGLAARLNALRTPPPGPRRANTRKRGWSTITIKEVIQNPAYRGALAWNRRTFAKFNTLKSGQAKARPKSRMNKQERNPEADWIVQEDQHEALVTPDTWHAAQRMMRQRAGTTTESQRRATSRNSPFLLSGLVVCARCGSRWQGYKTRQGRKKEGATPVETFYYACGGYVRSGNAVCQRALVAKEDLEALVMDAMLERVGAFVTTGGADMVAALVSTQATTTEAPTAMAERLKADKKRLNDLVGSLSPAMAPLLEPRILELQQSIQDGEQAMQAMKARVVDEARVKEAVADLVHDLGHIASTVRTAPFLEQREIVRSITSGVVVNPDAEEAVVRFHAVPQVAAINEKRTGREVLSSHRSIAGDHLFSTESRNPLRIRRFLPPGWVLRRSA